MTWKLPAPGNFSDNSRHPGNMLADIDMDTGRVSRVVRGAGVGLELPRRHPTTCRELVGFQIPHFEQLKAVVLRGATLIPRIRTQGWDVAIGPDGPIVVEVNNGSGYSAPQRASGRGLLTPEFADFLAVAEAENETWPWREFIERQEHGHRFGRSRGVLRVLGQAVFRTGKAGRDEGPEGTCRRSGSTASACRHSMRAGPGRGCLRPRWLPIPTTGISGAGCATSGCRWTSTSRCSSAGQ